MGIRIGAARIDQTIEIVTPARLHFGLLSLEGGTRRFGGAGVMIDAPCWRIRAVFQRPARERSARVAAAGDRIGEFCHRWSRFYDLPQPRDLMFEVVEQPPSHVGLGSGTQLALAVATLLNGVTGRPQPHPEELARSVGRGLRSAVGTYGFGRGGLIVDRGKQPGQHLAPLDCHVDLPESWRFVLVRPADGSAGLSGSAERSAFQKLPAVSAERTAELQSVLRQQMIPAALQADVERFGDSLNRYGYLAGELFASCQGGAYNGPVLQRLVEQLQQLGARGVGQSSWGPTLFSVFADHESAASFVPRIRQLDGPRLTCDIVAPSRAGARMDRLTRHDAGHES